MSCFSIFKIKEYLLDMNLVAWKNAEKTGRSILVVLYFLIYTTIAISQTLDFTDITTAAGTGGPVGKGETGGHAAAFADVDGDGRSDLYHTMLNKTFMADLFFYNLGANVFANEGSARGIDDFDGGSHGAVFSDLDNDGDFDLFNGTTGLAPNSESNNIFRNDGNGYFTDLTAGTPLFTQQFPTRGVLTFDMDRDGDLDLLAITNYQGSNDPPGEKNELYRNDGNFVFTALTIGALVDAPAGQGATDTDYDNDGDIDIFAGNRNGDLNILNNNGVGVFTLISPTTIGINHKGREGVSVGDVNNDGFIDLLLSDYDELAKSAMEHLYINNGKGVFTFSQTFLDTKGYMGGFADLDNDGDLDLICSGDVLVYLNDGFGNFPNGSAVPVSGLTDPRAIAFSDIDNDGDLDFAIGAKRSRNYLIRNNFNSGNWLKIRLVSPSGQAGAYGAKVKIYPAGMAGGSLFAYREARSQSGYLGQNDPVLHVGLGANSAVDVKVIFLDGSEVAQNNVAANQIIVVDGSNSGGGLPEITSLSPQTGAPGVMVRLTGKNFTGANSVEFDGSPASSFIVDSDLVIRAIVPPGARTGVISVTSPIGLGASSTEFVVISSAKITAISGLAQRDTVAQTLPELIGIRVTDANQNPIQGVTVDYQVLTGGGSVSVGAANQLTNANGEAFVNWTLGSALGDNSLQVSVTGLPSLIYTATGLPDSVAQITKLGGDNQQGVPGLPLAQPFSVGLVDKWGNVASGAPLTFSLVAPANGSLSVTSTTADFLGQAASLLTMGANSAINQIRVTAPGYIGPEVLFSTTAQPGAPSSIALQDGDGQTESAGKPLPAPLRVVVKDKNSIPVPNIEVTFSVVQGDGNFGGASSVAANTNQAGIAQATPVLGSLAAAANRFQGSVVGLTGSPVLFSAVSAAPAKLVAISVISQSGIVGLPFADSVEIKVVDQFDSPVSGHPVNFAVTAGNGFVNGGATWNMTINSDGVARVEWRMGSGTGKQRLLVSSSYNGSNLQDSPITFRATAAPGAAAKMEIVSGDKQSGVVGQPLAGKITFLVTDSLSNPVPQIAVTFRVQSGGGSVNGVTDSDTSVVILTDGDGFAEAIWYMGCEVGKNKQILQIIARNGDDNLNGAPRSVLATALAGEIDADLSVVSSDKEKVRANGQAEAIVQVRLTDLCGNPIAGQAVVIVSSRPDDIIRQPASLTDEYGQTTGGVSSGKVGVSVISARITGGVNLSSSVPVEFSNIVSVNSSTFRVELAGFSGVNIHWETSVEINTAGFNILRSERREGSFLPINSAMIAPKGAGAYTYADGNVEPGRTYYYQLEEIGVDGFVTLLKTINIQVAAPERFELSQNYPNPFNPVTNIRYQLTESGFVKVIVFDVTGRTVRALVNEERDAGFHTVQWDARNNAGQKVASGVYYYRVIADEYRQTKSMFLVK